MACRHGLEEDCEPCEERADIRRHERAGDRPCTSCRRWVPSSWALDECEECALNSGALKWCSDCEDCTTANVDGVCDACVVKRENAAEAADIESENEKFFGGGFRY